MTSREADLRALLLQIADGEHAAVQELFALERESLMRLFFGLCRSSIGAEDLLQNTFLNLWRYRQNYRGRGHASAYIYRIAINQWRQAQIREKRHREVWQGVAQENGEMILQEPGERLEKAEAKRAVWSAIESLPDPQRETFLLHRFQGLSCPQIAEITSNPLKTVESRLRLALKKLTEKLQLQEGLQ